MGRAGFDVRKLIGLLLALNLGVLVAGLALQRLPQGAPDAAFNAEKIRLLALTAPVPLPSAPAKPDELPSEKSTPSPEIADMPREEAPTRCLRWPSLDMAGWQAVAKHLDQAGIAVGNYDIELDKPLGWWVFLPPQKSAQEAQERIDELERLGIKDYALVRGTSMPNAVSLGAFAHLAQARKHAATLSREGIVDAVFGPRPEVGAARLILTPAVSDGTLLKLRKDWPTGLQPVPCAE